MDKIKVLVIDDSMILRKAIGSTLKKDPEIEVVDFAENGKIALEKLATLKPDLVTLDVEMPVMDGLTTLKEIKKLYPKLPVIMCSTLTKAGAGVTVEALSLGATDYIAKPSNTGGLQESLSVLEHDLVPKVKALGRKKVFARPAIAKTESSALKSPGTISKAATLPPKRRKPILPAKIVAIGVSTGGPKALDYVIPKLPQGFKVPIVIVQHMPPVFTKSLAERLDRKSQVTVTEAVDGETLMPGRAYIAPGDYHMVLEKVGVDVKIKLNQEAKENSCRPAVDPLFRSVAEVYKDRCCAVILTGMGSDGAKGCVDIAAKGGGIIVQDEETCVVWGMPGAVVAEGLAEMELPLEHISGEILKRV